MNKNEAINLLIESFSKPCSTPNTTELTDVEFLDREKAALLCLVATPVEVTAYTSEWVRTYGEFQGETYSMQVIAGADDRWLLYNEATDLFSLAEGRIDKKIILVGYAYTDALAEWRG